MIGTATKGPVNTPTLITSPEQFVQTFGNPITTSYLGYAALAYLENGNQLWINRVGATTGTDKLTKAEATLVDGTASTVTAATAGSYTLAIDKTISLIVNGTTQQNIVVDADTYTATQLANVINGQLVGGYADSATNALRFTSFKKGALSTLEVVSIDNSLFSFPSITAATKTGTVIGPFAITATNKYLKINVNGTAIVTIALTEGGARTESQISSEINAALSAYRGAATTSAGAVRVYTLDSGSGTSIEFLDVTNSAYTTLGLPTPGSLTAKTSGTSAIAAGVDGSTDLLTFTAINEGTWGNDLNIAITNKVDYSTLTSPVDKFDVTISLADVVVEAYQNCVRGTANVADTKYIETLINGISQYVTVVDEAASTGTPMDIIAGGADGDLAGGLNGIAGVSDGDYIGVAWDAILQKPTGLQAFANAETIDINIVAIPGVTSSDVIGAMLQLCSNRADCMAIVDSPRGYSPQEVVNWHNNVDGSGNALNSSYGALYHDWLKIYDSYNKVTVSVPPSGHIAGVYAKNDFLAEAWYAPAGYNRGRILSVISTESTPSKGERDLMYGGTNAVNPIVNFITDGVTVFGQKTLQRTSTSLDRVNVRRLMLYLRKVAARAARAFLFEQNTPTLWKRVAGSFDGLLSDVQSRGGITDFRTICDETINTPERIDRNELWIRILIKPVKAVEFIQLDFVLMPTGATLLEETTV